MRDCVNGYYGGSHYRRHSSMKSLRSDIECALIDENWDATLVSREIAQAWIDDLTADFNVRSVNVTFNNRKVKNQWGMAYIYTRCIEFYTGNTRPGNSVMTLAHEFSHILAADKFGYRRGHGVSFKRAYKMVVARMNRS